MATIKSLEEVLREFDEKFVIAKLTQPQAIAKLSRDQSEAIKAFLTQAIKTAFEATEVGEHKFESMLNTYERGYNAAVSAQREAREKFLDTEGEKCKQVK